MTIQTGDNKFGVSEWIVDPTAGLGTHTTIAAAIADASSGEYVFIRPGTYTEDLTLKAGVNLLSFVGNQDDGQVVIIGNNTATFAGSVTLSGIRLQTNSAPFLTVSGASATVISLRDCDLNITDNDGMIFSSSSASASIILNECTGDISTTGIKIYDHSSAGSLFFRNVSLTNSGSSVTTSTCSAGSTFLCESRFASPLESSGTASLQLELSGLENGPLNTPMLTIGASGGNTATFTNITGGTSPAVSVSGSVTLRHCSLLSNNVNIVSGAGTCRYMACTVGLSSATIAAGTNVGQRFYTGSISFDEGTTNLDSYEEGSWTPQLQFGGANVGMTGTFTARYTRTGRVVYVTFDITLTAVGSSTGVATIINLPFTSFADIPVDFSSISYENLTYIASRTHVIGTVPGGGTTINLLMDGDNVAETALQNTEFANTTSINGQAFYFV